jgi:uncharacterized protein YcgI (DUF1989 family)
VQRILIPACEGRGVRIPAGTRFRVVDVEGQQCVDLFVLSADDVTEYVSPDHTRVELYRMFPRVGQHFFTNRRREILLFEEDGSPGVHDMLIAACDPARYARLGVQGWHASCQENFLKVVRELGLDYRRNEESGHVNLFTNIAIREDGSMDWLPAPSKAGDYVVLRAEMDCYVIVVACAQDILPINAHKPSSLALEILD